MMHPTKFHQKTSIYIWRGTMSGQSPVWENPEINIQQSNICGLQDLYSGQQCTSSQVLSLLDGAESIQQHHLQWIHLWGLINCFVWFYPFWGKKAAIMVWRNPKQIEAKTQYESSFYTSLVVSLGFICKVVNVLNSCDISSWWQLP